MIFPRLSRCATWTHNNLSVPLKLKSISIFILKSAKSRNLKTISEVPIGISLSHLSDTLKRAGGFLFTLFCKLA